MWLWEEPELGLESLGIRTFKGIGENKVSSGKARKTGEKPGQDTMEIRVEE